jgi:hypothetical protein
MNKLPIGLVAYARFFESYFTKTNENECKKNSSRSCLSLEHIKIYVKRLDLNASPRFTNVKQWNDQCNPLSYHAIEYSEKMRRYYNHYDEVLGTSFYVYMYMFGSKTNGNLQVF